jgi:hypothetical protein
LSARPQAESGEGVTVPGLVPCPLCALPKEPDVRCPSCGLTAEFGPDRPNPFAGATLWLMAAAIAVVFAVTLLVVALTG